MSRDLLGVLPPVRGRYRAEVPLAPSTWLRVGGAAEVMFQPADAADLAGFIAGQTRLGRGSRRSASGPTCWSATAGPKASSLRFAGGARQGRGRGGPRLRVGAGATDRMIAIQALKAGLAGLEFLIGIPGTLGGAVRMNAGAFGGETAAVVERVTALEPAGRRHELGRRGARLRLSPLGPAGRLDRARRRAPGTPGDRSAIEARMRAIKAEREATQPLHVAPAAAPSRTRRATRPGN